MAILNRRRTTIPRDRRLLNLAAAALLVGVAWLNGETACALPPGTGALVWSDEFNGDELDLTKWFHRASGPRHDGVLTAEAVSVADGALTIKTYTEGGVHYSGMIGNYLYNPLFGVGAVNGMNHAYGYFEVRARFHTTSGVASAFWLQSATIGGGPPPFPPPPPSPSPELRGVEMDVFEHRVYNSFDYFNYPGLTPTTDISNRINQAMIWNGYDNPYQQTRSQLSNPLPGLVNNPPPGSPNDGWHTIGLKWTPTGYAFYFDGTPIWTATADTPISQAPQYVILSSEVLEFFAGPIPLEGYGARGDFDGSGMVDGADFLAWQRTVGDAVGRGSGADASANGIVGAEDLAIWAANFGRAASTTNVQFDYVRVYALATAADAVPEPGGLALLASGLFLGCSC